MSVLWELARLTRESRQFLVEAIMAIPTPVGFDEKKAAQIANAFASKSKDGLDKMKLIKLIYLAEREFVSRHGHPMLFDEFYSLEHGPICSSALNGLNLELDEKLWGSFIRKDDNKIIATGTPKREALDHVSAAEWKALDDTWAKYGHMTAAELRAHTHDNCAEYEEVPSGRRLQISYKDLFKALGFDDPAECEQRIMDTRGAHKILSY